MKENQNEAMANALKPLTGWTPQQRETAIRRVHLPEAAKAECGALDRDIPDREAAERVASASEKTAVQVKLYQARKRFKDLAC